VLWYKAWLETRTRFAVCLCFLVAIVGFFVHHAEGILPPQPKSNTYEVLFFAHTYLAGIWILCVNLLGMGGLLREKTAGTSLFTLALPVSRARLVGVRIAVGVLESIALAVVPWGMILLITYLAGRPFFVAQAGYYVLLLVGGGIVYFAVAILASSLVEGEYTAPAVSYGAAILVGIIGGSITRLRPFLDLWRFVAGDNRYDHSTHLLTGPVPWFGIFCCVSVAVLLFAVSARIAQKRDF
jgi:ABC-type transport system involved in multi-copper enzyme maturation permease subunit